MKEREKETESKAGRDAAPIRTYDSYDEHCAERRRKLQALAHGDDDGDDNDDDAAGHHPDGVLSRTRRRKNTDTPTTPEFVPTAQPCLRYTIPPIPAAILRHDVSRRCRRRVPTPPERRRRCRPSPQVQPRLHELKGVRNASQRLVQIIDIAMKTLMKRFVAEFLLAFFCHFATKLQHADFEAKHMSVIFCVRFFIRRTIL